MRLSRILKLTVFTLALVGMLVLSAPAALAGLTDDHFDGNIFALYGGNGSLVPPRVSLKQALEQQRPTMLVFYVNDSRDCKQFATTVSQVQAYYGKVADIIPVNVDAIVPAENYAANEPGYYYQGVVPQTVVFNQASQPVLNVEGQVAFEQIDDVFRQVFDLLPRSESVPLKRRLVNEINTELAE
jgi:hypothetical protein